MKQEPQSFEKYPFSTIFITNIVNLIIWIVSVYLVWQIGVIWGVLFIIYLIINELFIYKEGCSSCYYYDKHCAFGRGKIAKLIVKQKTSEKFCQKKVTWLSLLPVVLGSLIPVVIGVFLLIQSFNWFIFILTLIPLINWFFITPMVFGKLVCLHCKQGRICCPANDFFGKKVK